MNLGPLTCHHPSMSARNSRKARADTREYARVKRGMVLAAAELMQGDGFRQFRFEQLAEKLGCNRATLYRYFDSKQDLVTEVMLCLMQEITQDIIRQTAGTRLTRERFTEGLHEIIGRLRTCPRYALVMDAQNIETFAQLTHERFSSITTSMLEKFLVTDAAGPKLKGDVSLSEVVAWLMHQIISYGFLGIPGATASEQKAYLQKMVVSVIL